MELLAKSEKIWNEVKRNFGGPDHTKMVGYPGDKATRDIAFW